VRIRQPKPDPTTMYVAWNAFATDHPEPNTTVGRGQVLRGDDPIVRAHASNFVPAGERLPSVDAMVAKGAA